MRTFSRVNLNGSSGWFWFWAAALLILPNCSLARSAIGAPSSNVTRGDPPRTGVIFCDIERPGGRRCPTAADDLTAGIRLASGAVALVAGQTSTFALDDSPDALARCMGQPEIVTFQGPFPEGTNVCLNCSVIGPSPAPHASNNAVCQALCLDLFATGDANVPASPEATAFCTAARAHVSTNFPTDSCLESACTTMATLRPTFSDPRRIPEPVEWSNLDGVSASGGSLTRTAPFTDAYDAGASSPASQMITGGDAYLEFTVTETNRARIVGLSSGPPPPGGITYFDVGFGILLTETAGLFVGESGPLVSGFGEYNPLDKFRIKLRDNFDGTATVTYVRITGPCVDGSPCSEELLHESMNLATYPVRVDAMFKELGGTVTEARIVRIR